MYIAIRKYQVDTQARNEVTRQVREGFVPIVSATAGFRGYYWLQAEDGSMLSISLSDDKAGADASIDEAKDSSPSAWRSSCRTRPRSPRVGCSCIKSAKAAINYAEAETRRLKPRQRRAKPACAG
ncbi:MAG TPA: hypothetical protein VKY74_22970 [Chloroflexia bacterium]|nr:hypothetical protein [Chloroflexia bacterium]